MNVRPRSCHTSDGRCRHTGMRAAYKRMAATGLGGSAAFVGLWAQLGPRSFYESFPLPGHHWIAPTGAFNEHFVRNVGGLYLALGVISAWAAFRPTLERTRLAGTAWSIFNLPHLLFHVNHLDEFGRADQVGNLVTLISLVALGLVLLTPGPATTATPPGGGQVRRPVDDASRRWYGPAARGR